MSGGWRECRGCVYTSMPQTVRPPHTHTYTPPRMYTCALCLPVAPPQFPRIRVQYNDSQLTTPNNPCPFSPAVLVSVETHTHWVRSLAVETSLPRMPPDVAPPAQMVTICCCCCCSCSCLVAVCSCSCLVAVCSCLSCCCCSSCSSCSCLVAVCSCTFSHPLVLLRHSSLRLLAAGR